ncbi:hypothetical protein CHUAL_008537 [Chamberlinius hualienensis]
MENSNELPVYVNSIDDNNNYTVECNEEQEDHDMNDDMWMDIEEEVISMEDDDAIYIDIDIFTVIHCLGNPLFCNCPDCDAIKNQETEEELYSSDDDDDKSNADSSCCADDEEGAFSDYDLMDDLYEDD